MCGIAGILSRGGEPASREALARMASALSHRGPDERGMYRDRFVGLAHTRLSIIDLATGQQPMANEDETLWVVFNGEIFNYVELREELLALGHTFRTTSDTEVIVHAFESWGRDAFTRFNGQFAIALWDARAKRLTLARDRAGVRPLFLVEHAGRLLFASEARALFAADASIPRELDPVGIDETFTFWSVVAPQSVFKGVEELPPGCSRTYAAEGTSEHRYHRPSYPRGGMPPFTLSDEEAASHVLGALERATSLRLLRADVPVGCYLSGGLDSSLVAALGLRAKPEGFRTFSLRFEDAEYDETRYQRAVRDMLGTEHYEVVVSRRDIAEIFPSVVAHTERPLLRTGPAPMYLLSRLVREQGVKVVLTGEGADEVFAGYDLFREAKVRRFWARQPESTSRPRLIERLYPYLERSPAAQQAMARRFFGRELHRYREPGFSHDPRWHAAAALKRLFSGEQREATKGTDVVARLVSRLPPEFSEWTTLSQDQHLEITTLLPGYILSSQGDRMLMANSIEGRFPFLDRDVMELAARLPPRLKLRVLDEKYIVKRVARGLIPDEVVRRKKQPYRAPDAACFVADDSPAWVREVLSEEHVRSAGVFEPRAVAQLFEKCRSARDAALSNADNMALVGVLSTQLLHEQLKTPPRAEDRVEFGTLVDRVAVPT
jgi:asparagine synthase (glutamine-hydrolysing)